ncbi:hypothetical protein [Shuttleworthella satelles]|nr:hypothetical protein [Shuttleworthia satelles]
MLTYKFKSGTSKSDMIMGLGLPVIVGMPALITYLILFYTRGNMFSEHRLSGLIAFLPGLVVTCFLMKRMRNHLVKDYVVELVGADIKIWENGRQIVSGPILHCRMNAVRDRVIRIDIFSDVGQISFRARPEEYRTINGFLSFNPFGTSSSSDMETLLSLGVKIRSAV